MNTSSTSFNSKYILVNFNDILNYIILLEVIFENIIMSLIEIIDISYTCTMCIAHVSIFLK